MRPVLIDLDGTLIDGPTAESLFFDYLSRRNILKSKHYFSYFWFMARWFFRYGVGIKRVNKAYVAGMRRADVDVYAHSFVKNILLDLVRPEMWARIEEHQQQDDIIILLTEAPEFLLRPIAKRMEIPYWRGTICAYLMNQYLPKPPVVHPFGDKKVDIARKICNELGYDLSHATAYADSSDDLPLLGEVGKPVVVHPDRRLRREAQRQGWEIIL